MKNHFITITSTPTQANKSLPKVKATVFSTLAYAWAITSAVIPSLLIYALFAYGSPAFWVETKNRKCIYLDLLGSFQVKQPSRSCSWYAFRDLGLGQQAKDIFRGEEND